MRDILGGKGAGLAEMANLGLPVPPGFTISAKLCISYLEHGTFPDDLREEVDRHLKQLERASKKRFGDAPQPGPERRDRAGADRGLEEPRVRLRLLPPLCPDVRRRGVRSRQSAV